MAKFEHGALVGAGDTTARRGLRARAERVRCAGQRPTLGSCYFLNLESLDVRVRFAELLQRILHDKIGIRELELARPLGDIRFNFGDAFDLGQIASNRGGAAASSHVGQLERHESDRRGRFPGYGGCVVRFHRRRFGSLLAAEAARGRQGEPRRWGSNVHTHSFLKVTATRPHARTGSPDVAPPGYL